MVVLVQGSSTTDTAGSATVRSSSLDQSFLDNVDLRQLDRYGESVALRHATAAADRHGRTVVVLYHLDDDCWYVCTPILMPQKRMKMMQQQRDDSLPPPPLLQTILRRTEKGHNFDAAAASLLYLVATGVAGDAQYLVSELQRYGVMIKHRFGHSMSQNYWEQRIIPYLLRRCFNYDERQAWNMPVVDEYLEDEDKKFPYSRPLGLRAVLCRYDETNRRWHVSSLDPSGTLSPIGESYKNDNDYGCFVMGKEAQTIQERLQMLHRQTKEEGEKDYRDEPHDPSSSSSAATAIEALLRTAFDEGRPLQLEILRPDGSLERRTIAANSAAR
jgi:20S proteasome alpha/beta subunit